MTIDYRRSLVFKAEHRVGVTVSCPFIGDCLQTIPHIKGRGMSSAGHIFRETIYKINETSTGEKVLDFDVENDGFILYMERVSGNGKVGCEVLEQLPDTMGELSIHKFYLNDGHIYSRGYICSRRGRLRVSWEGSNEVRIAIKMASGAAIVAYNDTSESTEAAQVARDEELLSMMTILLDQNDKIINHLRQITDINSDEGDEF